MATKTLDEILADNAALTTKVTNLEAQVGTLTGENTTLKSEKTSLTNDLATAKSNLTSVTSERDTLKTENANLKTERDDWKAKAGPVQEQVAAQCAKLGIVDGKKAENPTANNGGAKLNTTQKCLQKKGHAINAKVNLAVPLVGGTVVSGGDEIAE